MLALGVLKFSLANSEIVSPNILNYYYYQFFLTVFETRKEHLSEMK